jgi:EAL domain-containing protein (putative c-di-GMP-specific phosphodiesterase class I)
VLETVVDQWADWKLQTDTINDMYVSVNLSSSQLRDDTIVTRVAELLKANRLAGSSLCLELTESLAMQDPILSAELLGRLRRLGIGVALDDFGAEYSSLSHLRRLPASMLKIDKSFVDSLSYEDTADASLIAAVVAMARSLGITTVAEGVESSFQAARLVSLRVDAVQGYFYSRPVTPDRLIDTVESLGARTLRPGSAPIG